MTVNFIPDGMHAVTAHLVCAGAADAIEFYKKAFDAEELSRMPGPNNRIMHASMRIGDSVVMLADEFPEYGGKCPLTLGGSPVTLHLYVPNADEIYAQALAAGATVKMPMADMFWGDRYGQLVDPYGHHWSIATHMHDYTPEQMDEQMKKSMPPQA